MDEKLFETAVQAAMKLIKTSSDWQDVENALWNDDRFHKALATGPDDRIAMDIIHEAETRLGDDMPEGYS